jgi:2-dehydro-3-deoxyphosphogluconate aldolase/(4S)-4-hydroxy-2-oxoglutarate aldolase
VNGAAGGKQDTMNEARIVVQGDSARTTEQVSQASQFDYPAAATLTNHEVCNCIEDTGVVPSLAEASTEDAVFIAEALTEAGIPIIEISMNSPDAIDIVSLLVKHAPTTIVGVGSVRNGDIARRCLDAGARFLSTDGLIPGVAEIASNEKVVAITGALTLTEVISAWDAGTDFVKVVPCFAVGGHNYIRTLKAAVPQARLIAAGGINQLTAANYIMAGAAALGVGKALIPTEAVVLRQARRIQELARRFLTAVDKGRD